MNCTKCGYALSAFDKDCPRCAKQEILVSSVSQRPTSPASGQHSPHQNPGTQNDPSQPQNYGQPSFVGSTSTVQSNKTANAAWIVAGVLGVALVGSLVRGGGGAAPPSSVAAPPSPVASPSQQPVPTPVPTTVNVPAGPSFDDMDDHMNDQVTSLTSAQKTAYWESIQGSQITWSGILEGASMDEDGGSIQVRCSRRSNFADVDVTIVPEQVSKLGQLSKGQQVTFTGIVYGYGSTFYYITSGRISGL